MCIRDSGGVVHSGHDRAGFHLAAGDCRAGPAQLRRPARAVRASDLGGHSGGPGAGGDRCLDVGAQVTPRRARSKNPKDRVDKPSVVVRDAALTPWASGQMRFQQSPRCIVKIVATMGGCRVLHGASAGESLQFLMSPIL